MKRHYGVTRALLHQIYNRHGKFKIGVQLDLHAANRPDANFEVERNWWVIIDEAAGGL